MPNTPAWLKEVCAYGWCGVAAGMAHAGQLVDATGADDTAALNEVVVTGSRLPTLAREEMLPVTILDAADLARGGSDSLSKILQTLPMSASSVLNTNVNGAGDGSARVDLRALQPWRTLVLLNGHRLPEGGVGGDLSVDLNSLPVSMIERIEVLTSGGSVIYGADAVSGVVNLITFVAVVQKRRLPIGQVVDAHPGATRAAIPLTPTAAAPGCVPVQRGKLFTDEG